MKTTYYTILTTEHGQALQCARCHTISYHPDDVSHRYCSFCKLFLTDLTGPLPPLTLAEFQILYARLYRFLTAEATMRDKVFPQGHPRRAEKLMAVQQAITDLIKFKDILKQQFLIELAEADPSTQQPTQFRLLDVPVKANYQ